MTEGEQIFCKYCNTLVSINDYFCRNCGKKLKPKPLETTWQKQLVSYLVSALLPPLGLYYVWKYLKQSNEKAKIVGIINLVITIVMVIVSIWIFVDFLNAVNQELNSLDSIYNLGGF